ncbi:MAG: hypothetical protein ABL921_24065 [Pirellula sp.]
MRAIVVASIVIYTVMAAKLELQAQEAIARDAVAPSIDGMWGYSAPTNYKILPRPATHANKKDQHTYAASPSAIESRPVQPYAYGWFGTKPSPQWYRSFGNRKTHTQWTLK